jgi:hypothetical protein
MFQANETVPSFAMLAIGLFWKMAWGTREAELKRKEG